MNSMSLTPICLFFSLIYAGQGNELAIKSLSAEANRTEATVVKL